MELIPLNLIPKSNNQIVTCSRNDYGSLRRWEFELYNGSERWTIDATTVKLVCSNGKEITGSVSSNRVVIDATSELTANPGCFEAKLYFEKEETKMFSSSFYLWVEDL